MVLSVIDIRLPTEAICEASTRPRRVGRGAGALLHETNPALSYMTYVSAALSGRHGCNYFGVSQSPIARPGIFGSSSPKPLDVGRRSGLRGRRLRYGIMD